jgi:hypothetical protein
MGPSPPAAWFVDAHVHLYPAFSMEAVLEGVQGHLEGMGRAPGASPVALVYLLMADREGEDHFVRIRDGGAGPLATPPPPWRRQRTGEDESILLLPPHGPPLVLVQGRQVATREGLEVLALCSGVQIPDGLPLEETARRAVQAGALTVIPWGFGKWWLGRGRTVSRLLAGELGDRVHLGDNGNRWAGAGEPPLFQRGRALGRPVLPGSDPLPFPHHARRVGSYGFRITGALDADRPAAALRRALEEAAPGEVEPVGRLQGAASFLRDQLRMQFRRRAPVRGATPAGQALRDAGVQEGAEA